MFRLILYKFIGYNLAFHTEYFIMLPDSDQISLASVISLRSIPDDFVLESNRSLVKEKVPKVPKKGLPYGSSSKSKKVPKKTGREVWVNAIQNGTGLSMESSAMNSLKLNKGGSQSSASLYLKEALGMKTGKQNRPLSATSRVGGTGPVYKDAETYYDEIQILKNTMKQLKNDNDIMKAKNLRLEEENIAKSKKIDELLNPDTQSNDLRRTLTSKKPSSSEVVMSLRRKIYKLEETLRNKENETRKIVTDMKYTNSEELRIENQVYLSEINRLNAVLHDTQNQRSLLSDQMVNDALKYSNGTKTEIVIKKLTEENQSLILQNKSLKSDILKQSSNNLQVDLNKDCEDMSRNELLQKIAMLEQKVKQSEKLDGSCTDHPNKDKSGEDLHEKSIELRGSLPQQIKQLRSREKELLEQIDCLESSVAKLKEERTHYRKMTDDFRQQIEANKKTPVTLQSKASTVENETKISNEIRKKSFIQKSSPENLKEAELANERAELVKEERLNALKENEAATTIQRSWRNRKNKIEKDQNNYEEILINSVIEIQAALKGHLARQKFIDSINEDKNKSGVLKNLLKKEPYESDILLIQSTFRAHAVRSQFLNKNKNDEEKQVNKVENHVKKNKKGTYHSSDDKENNVKSIDELSNIDSDEDDDVVVGSSVSLSKYRNNQKSSYNVNNSKTQPEKESKENNEKSFKNNGRSNLKFSFDTDHKNQQKHKDSNDKPRSKGSLELFVDSDSLHDKKNRKMTQATSVTQLKASSNPWSNNSQLISNEDDDDEDDENDELVCTSTLGRKQDKLKKETASKKDKDELAMKWASSGLQSKKSKDSILSNKHSQLQTSIKNATDDNIKPHQIQRKLVKSKFALDDELF
ncbi:IQ domain-containing protein E isoform X1 [Hydra vulgaris]|uniref:IQ domain-containing protein E isoform X1 n=2 Tax=Hydra vulgaris TaxID=6087 RepID=UPI001F5F9F77|nr:IQ domain-containing protein E isoform X1 [Hydra vulgaris]XP_047126801.1 IQ domain-containing protein E isoform X2 [Hydra vulgaris]